jgi:HJR/Mrr/RecB family endonuclease
VVITSHFTKNAKNLAFSNFVELWDQEKLSQILTRF